jgi:hypothetical protein
MVNPFDNDLIIDLIQEQAGDHLTQYVLLSLQRQYCSYTLSEKRERSPVLVIPLPCFQLC